MVRSTPFDLSLDGQRSKGERWCLLYRGPKGIWTLQRAGKELPQLKTSFSFAVPTLTHQVDADSHVWLLIRILWRQALRCLVERNMVDFVVSQNVDGLHLRSGLPPEKLAELHGNCFSEKCSVCQATYVRDFEMETVSKQSPWFHAVIYNCRLGGVLLDGSTVRCRWMHWTIERQYFGLG